jgi:ribosomal protein L29
MKRLRTSELSKLSKEDLVTRLNSLRSELSTLRSKAARGTLKKELGEIKTVRRNIARIFTALNAQKSESTSQMRSLRSIKEKEESEEKKS